MNEARFTPRLTPLATTQARVLNLSSEAVGIVPQIAP